MIQRVAAVAALLFMACSTGRSSNQAGSFVANPTPLIERESCYNGTGFFRVDPTSLQDRLPEGFRVRDGSLLGPQHQGHGLLALIYYSCSEPEPFRLFLAATPVEDPAWVVDLREVRWNWYEFARLTDTEERLDSYSDQGLAAALASMSHDPFQEGDSISTFRAEMEGRPVARVRAELTDSVNFQPQSHRFWHRTDSGNLVSTRLDFAYHHSWVGGFRDCDLDAARIHGSLAGLSCSGIGVTEAIESLSFDEQIVAWH